MIDMRETKEPLLMSSMPSPVGELRLFARGDALTGVYAGMQTPPEARVQSARILERAAEQLAAYFAGELTVFDLPLAPEGTEFQQKVWMLLRAIPFGETRSYGQLATKLRRPTASRAVGAANGRNPLGIIVPCHRVIGANGDLTGYAGGLAMKKWLLAHEQRQQSLIH
jgi:methylated-DNA-[protein]-cysteine S-methyltransferase